MNLTLDEQSIRKTVKEHYTQVANRETSCCGAKREYTGKIGYSGSDLSRVPEAAIAASAGCGNPTAIAMLQPGMTVLDLGSGGGIDVFISAEAVGATGKAIGVDCTPEMIWRARKTAADMKIGNVEFRLGEIECMPVESDTVDVAISNCVINLSPDKDRVFREVFRVLKPGGRLAVSDMMLTEAVGRDEREVLQTWAGCIGGAISEAEYQQKIAEAGFVDVTVESRHVYTAEEMSGMASKAKAAGQTGLDVLDAGKGLSKVSSLKISATKPKCNCECKCQSA